MCFDSRRCTKMHLHWAFALILARGDDPFFPDVSTAFGGSKEVWKEGKGGEENKNSFPEQKYWVCFGQWWRWDFAHVLQLLSLLCWQVIELREELSSVLDQQRSLKHQLDETTDQRQTLRQSVMDLTDDRDSLWVLTSLSCVLLLTGSLCEL